MLKIIRKRCRFTSKTFAGNPPKKTTEQNLPMLDANGTENRDRHHCRRYARTVAVHFALLADGVREIWKQNYGGIFIWPQPITMCTANNNYTNIVHVHFGSCFICTYVTDDPRICPRAPMYTECSVKHKPPESAAVYKYDKPNDLDSQIY